MAQAIATALITNCSGSQSPADVSPAAYGSPGLTLPRWEGGAEGRFPVPPTKCKSSHGCGHKAMRSLKGKQESRQAGGLETDLAWTSPWVFFVPHLSRNESEER